MMIDLEKVKRDVAARGRKVTGISVMDELGVDTAGREAVYFSVNAVDDAGDTWPIEGYLSELDAERVAEGCRRRLRRNGG